ncbi:hypothetical protein QEN19_002906 [Hanseniaspora menglaensis]
MQNFNIFLVVSFHFFLLFNCYPLCKNSLIENKALINASSKNDFLNTSLLNQEGQIFLTYYKNNVDKFNKNIEIFDSKQINIAWNVVNLFFATTAAIEACSLPNVPPTNPNLNYKYIVCGLGLAGIVLNSAGILVAIAEQLNEKFQKEEINFFLKQMGFTVPENKYHFDLLNQKAIEKKFDKVFKQINNFRETEIFQSLVNLNISINMEPTFTHNNKGYNDYFISSSTNLNTGSLHNVKFNHYINENYVGKMGYNNYKNLPSEIIENMYFFFKSNRPLITDIEILRIIMSMGELADHDNVSYYNQVKNLFMNYDKTAV